VLSPTRQGGELGRAKLCSNVSSRPDLHRRTEFVHISRVSGIRNVIRCHRSDLRSMRGLGFFTVKESPGVFIRDANYASTFCALHEGLISFSRIVRAVVYASQRCAVILSFALRIYFHVLSDGDFLVLPVINYCFPAFQSSHERMIFVG